MKEFLNFPFLIKLSISNCPKRKIVSSSMLKNKTAYKRDKRGGKRKDSNELHAKEINL